MAKYLAISIRNSMENFHVEHLSDKQMAELNPIIRNSVYSALINIKKAEFGDKKAQSIVDWNCMMLPSYWEEPKEEVIENHKN